MLGYRLWLVHRWSSELSSQLSSEVMALLRSNARIMYHIPSEHQSLSDKDDIEDQSFHRFQCHSHVFAAIPTSQSRHLYSDASRNQCTR